MSTVNVLECDRCAARSEALAEDSYPNGWRRAALTSGNSPAIVLDLCATCAQEFQLVFMGGD